jgi:hypothetical protein
MYGKIRFQAPPAASEAFQVCKQCSNAALVTAEAPSWLLLGCVAVRYYVESSTGLHFKSLPTPAPLTGTCYCENVHLQYTSASTNVTLVAWLGQGSELSEGWQ